MVTIVKAVGTVFPEKTSPIQNIADPVIKRPGVKVILVREEQR